MSLNIKVLAIILVSNTWTWNLCVLIECFTVPLAWNLTFKTSSWWPKIITNDCWKWLNFNPKIFDNFDGWAGIYLAFKVLCCSLTNWFLICWGEVTGGLYFLVSYLTRNWSLCLGNSSNFPTSTTLACLVNVDDLGSWGRLAGYTGCDTVGCLKTRNFDGQGSSS